VREIRIPGLCPMLLCQRVIGKVHLMLCNCEYVCIQKSLSPQGQTLVIVLFPVSKIGFLLSINNKIIRNEKGEK
jgi:hypothetical protein